MTNPWADPATPTEPGPPYAGPPATAPVPGPYGYPSPYGQPPGYGWPPQYGPPYGWPPQYGYPMPWVPQPPRRPGQVITSAVLAFVQAGLVLFATLYVWMIASLADFAANDPDVPAAFRGLATEATVLAVVQVFSVVLLVVAGIRALTRRTRAAWILLLVAHGAQVALALYWAVRVMSLFGDLPDPGPDPGGIFAAYSLFFAAAPLVGLGLVLVGAGRRWFDGTAPA
ncbi:MAG TPA: hypothetical protein VK402_14645 [Blastococcus sp.]|nr:hypothetical protein [Blastococcus sp.]